VADSVRVMHLEIFKGIGYALAVFQGFVGFSLGIGCFGFFRMLAKTGIFCFADVNVARIYERTIKCGDLFQTLQGEP